MAGIVLRVSYILAHLILITIPSGGYYYSHIIDKETKAQKSQEIYPSSQQLVRGSTDI